jgi:hypothetical protein
MSVYNNMNIQKNRKNSHSQSNWVGVGKILADLHFFGGGGWGLYVKKGYGEKKKE